MHFHIYFLFALGLLDCWVVALVGRWGVGRWEMDAGGEWGREGGWCVSCHAEIHTHTPLPPPGQHHTKRHFTTHIPRVKHTHIILFSLRHTITRPRTRPCKSARLVPAPLSRFSSTFPFPVDAMSQSTSPDPRTTCAFSMKRKKKRSGVEREQRYARDAA